MSTRGRLHEVSSFLRAVAPRPRLWPTAAAQIRRFAPDRWWSRRPFLPLPDPGLLEFRATTQYGDPHHRIDPADVVTWLEWCRSEAPGRHR